MAMVLLRVILWGVIPLFLLVVAIGPRRLSAFWGWLWGGKLAPAEVLDRVVQDHQTRIARLKAVLDQSDRTQAEIQQNVRKSEENIAALEGEARRAVQREDDDEARAALAKIALERQAIQGFREQWKHHKERITSARRRLHRLELQLRQYEVGRAILLNQLAEAQTVEQQYELANQFDPTGAIAEWQRAEDNVQAVSENARAVEQVMNDTTTSPLDGQAGRIDPAEVDAQLALLKQQVQSERNGNRNGKSV